MITPQTKIRLLNVPFTSIQNNVVSFNNLNEQKQYFEGLEGLEFLNCTYQREDDGEYMQLNINADYCELYNYVMFQNGNYTNKWFYAFIEKIQYINPNTSRLFLKLDVFQTFMFDYSIGQTFIERETPPTDYYNFLDDIPSQGKLKTVYEKKFVFKKAFSQKGKFIVYLNADVTKEKCADLEVKTCRIGSYTIPCMVCLFDTSDEIANFLFKVGNLGRSDRVQSAFYLPTSEGLQFTTSTNDGGDIGKSFKVVESVQITIGKEYSFDIDYTPEFMKEYSYPYSEIQVIDTITGQSITLDWCKFNNPKKISFEIRPVFDEIGSYKIIPCGYNGANYSIENALSVEGKCDYPIFSNSYAKYMKDNKVLNTISKTMAGYGVVSSALSMNLNGVVSNIGNIAQTIAKDSQAKTIGNQVQNLNANVFEYLNYESGFIVRVNTLDYSHLEQARSFWKCFGYPVKKVTFPSLSKSRKFNYVKTIDCNINYSNIPVEYLNELKKIYDNGVTIWNGIDNYMNY